MRRREGGEVWVWWWGHREAWRMSECFEKEEHLVKVPSWGEDGS